MKRPRSLRTQLALCAGLLVAVVVALAGVAIALRIDHQDRAQVDRQLRSRAAKVQTDAGKTGRGSLLAEADKPGTGSDANLLAGTEAATRVFSGPRLVVQRGQGVPADLPAPSGTGLSTVEIGGVPWRSLVEPTSAVPAGRLQVLQSLTPVEQRLDDNARLIALVVGAATVLAALAAWLVAGLVLRPLERLRQGAAGIRAAGPADERLPTVDRPQEVAELSATLNEMLTRLASSTTVTRRFTADAGHELRTPLTGLGMDLETLRRNPDLSEERRTEMLDAMAAEHERVVALLDGLQQLARGDAEALPERVPVDLIDLTATAVRAAERRHPTVTFRYRAAVARGSLMVRGWPMGLRLAIDNLLDNAALHGRAGGTVDVDVTGDGPVVRLVVGDDGPGIPTAERDRLIQRFARGADVRSPGSGLGLALVEQQACLHGGELTFEDASGGGLRATIRLPGIKA